MQVTVVIPDQFVAQLVPNGADASRVLLEEAVAGAYRDRRLTMEQVRQLLGYGTRMQVDVFLQRHEIFDYAVEDLEKDMATLDRLFPADAKQSGGVIVVADTSPLNYLIRLGYIDILSELYGKVLVPHGVLLEMRHSGAPSEVRALASAPPSWLEEVEVRHVDTSLAEELGLGEREAITFALDAGRMYF